jgi:hypothetical protein
MDDNFPNEGRLPDRVPDVVQKLADQVKMTPIAWHIYPEKIVIVFEQGPKLSFNREDIQIKVVAARPEPKIIAPSIQKLPVKRQAKSK